MEINLELPLPIIPHETPSRSLVDTVDLEFDLECPGPVERPRIDDDS